MNSKLADPAESYFQLWSKAEKPDLAAFLAKAGPLPVDQLAEVVRIDQRQRWKAGEPVPAETIFRQFPELEDDPDVALDIIFSEFLLREKYGPQPEMDDFIGRFPMQTEILKGQIELHRALLTEHEQTNDTDMSHASLDNTLASVDPCRSARATVLPEVFGRYRIIKPLGQGGMGSVYLAHDSQLDRQVALKVPRFDLGQAKQLIERFYREARIAATFHHPNLCPVYDVGEIDRTPFLTMPFLTGEPLSDYLDRKRTLPQATACRLVMQVARAVHVAHQAGVRHRDLKPSNIMIQDEMQPVVMDFGLARRSGSAGNKLTGTGRLVGTIGYMPPEHITCGGEEIEPASDVYSLGVILFEMLTGRLPFDGKQAEIIHAVLTEPPPSPRQFQPAIDPTVEAVCLKALAKKAADRFATMAEFAAALEPFAVGQHGSVHVSVSVPVRASAKSRCIKARRTFLRIAAVGLTIASVGFLAWMVILSPSRLPSANSAEDPSAQSIASAGEPEPKEVSPARTVASGASEEPTKIPAKEGGSRAVLKGHNAPVTSLVFNPAAGKQLISGSQDGTIRVWDTTAEKEIANWKGTVGWIESVAFSPDGKQVVSGGGDANNLKWDVQIWDAASGINKVNLAGHSYFVSTVAFSRDGKRVASGAGDNTIRLWEPGKDKESTLLEGHTIWVRALAFHPKDNLLVSGGDDETIRLWDLTTGKNTAIWKGHERPVLAVAFSPDGRFVASGGEDRTIRLWEIVTGKTTAIFKGHEGNVRAVAFSPDGKQIVSGAGDKKVKLWNVADEKCIATLEGHKDRINAVVFSADGRTIATGSQDQTVILWDLPKTDN